LKLPLIRLCVASLLVAGLSGCVVLSPGHRAQHHRGVELRVALPVPHVVIRPGRYGDRYDRDRRGHWHGGY